MKGGPLWAIACLFNPQRYRIRPANFRVFRERLCIPMVAVELSFDGRYELEAEDADVLVRVAGGDVMWQKERLLNAGLAHLPDACEAVAVLDADIVFEDARWPLTALARLDRVPVVQLYAEVRDLEPGQEPLSGHGSRRRPGVVPEMLACDDPMGVMGPRSADAIQLPSPGHAWAYRRELLARHGLYDGCVIGGGDTAVACASWGAYEAVEERHAMNAAQRSYYRAWAEPWFADVRGAVAYLEGTIDHLWHGGFEQRALFRRHFGLAPHAFDPRGDLAGEPGGAWRWASDKPQMHRYLREYFASRREDDES